MKQGSATEKCEENADTGARTRRTTGTCQKDVDHTREISCEMKAGSEVRSCGELCIRVRFLRKPPAVANRLQSFIKRGPVLFGYVKRSCGQLDQLITSKTEALS